jgi:hypothetical protein
MKFFQRADRSAHDLLGRQSADRLPIIHAGFAHTGTTSLQENIFSKRADVFYAGQPYGELGGIFSYIKYLEGEHYSHDRTAALCDAYIHKAMKPGQRLVITDESLIDQPAIYYTPAMLPVRTIAERLHALFGPAVILFTLRNPLQRVISNYMVYKANSATVNREVEPFDAWFAGNCSQVRNLFLRTLDPSHAIKIYQDIFGASAVHVLPLELLTNTGAAAYLQRLGEITGLEITREEIASYTARNASPQHGISLTDRQRSVIRERSAKGNAFVAKTFDLPLAAYGYPC